MTSRASRTMTPLADDLDVALRRCDPDAFEALASRRPDNERDRYTTLLHIYALHTGPVQRLGPAVRWQHHPAIAALKQTCESAWLGELEALCLPSDLADAEPVAAMRTLAARDRLPAIYKWLARDATWPEVVHFLALEGGPDANFDDLVAACQVGLTGPAKMELATNYWDEMGDGSPDAVHTTLHDQLAAAIDLPRIALAAQPVPALARSAFGGLLATNRWLQPEMLGALGLIELQAGPRCRLVLQAFERCGAPAAAYPFYEVHAEVDPRHGKDWLHNAIAPIVRTHPEWGERIVRGALWRNAVNAAFLDEAAAMLVESRLAEVSAA
jgi:hypothetical protein